MHFLIIIVLLAVIGKILGSSNSQTIRVGLLRIGFVLALFGAFVGGALEYGYPLNVGWVIVGSIVGFAVVGSSVGVLLWIVSGFTGR